MSVGLIFVCFCAYIVVGHNQSLYTKDVFPRSFDRIFTL